MAPCGVFHHKESVSEDPVECLEAALEARFGFPAGVLASPAVYQPNDAIAPDQVMTVDPVYDSAPQSSVALTVRGAAQVNERLGIGYGGPHEASRACHGQPHSG